MRALRVSTLVCLLAAATAWAQPPPQSDLGPNDLVPGEPASDELPARVDARIEGVILNDLSGQPLRRARVLLQPLEAGLPAIAADADERGAFVLRNLPGGAYALSARRDGFLESGVALHDGLRMPSAFQLGAGQVVKGLVFRLKPWAVIGGRVRYDDGDAAVGVRVDVYRQFRARGRLTYRSVAAGVTNDLGEYRIHNLPAGAYFVSAIPTQLTSAEINAQEQVPDKPVTGYAMTFYPDTLRIQDAVPVELDAGRELSGLDLFLQETRKVALRGRITNGLDGTPATASIFLARIDAQNEAVLSIPTRAAFDKQQRFEIRNVAPGPYELWTEVTANGQRLVGRRAVTVGYDDVNDIEILAVPERKWSARVTVNGAQHLPDGYIPRVRLEPRNERAQIVEAAVKTSPQELALLPTETYDVFLPSLPGNFYVSAVRTGGTDVRIDGLRGSAAADAPFEIVLESNGGRVVGRFFDAKGDVMSGATIVLIPDPAGGRLQEYRETGADEYGQFALRGIAPGKYTLLAYIEEAPCDVYDAQALDACRATGVAITVAADSEQVDAFHMRAPR